MGQESVAMGPLLSGDIRGKSTRVLVVDDDPVVRSLVAECVMEGGYAADECGDGAEAIEKIRITPYEVIITDMMLPGVDGLSLIKKLKQNGTDTDVIVITGYGSIQNAVECMKEGARDYLVKPISADHILLALGKVVEFRELRRRAQYYEQQCNVDFLTGVGSRRCFEDALAKELLRAKRSGNAVTVLMLDIDDFKTYQSPRGNLTEERLHQLGDEALKQVGDILRASCRETDTVARWGGDEFVVVLPKASRENALEVAGRIMNSVRKSPFEGSESMPLGCLTVSVGLASFPEDAGTADDLFRCANQALFAAKLKGKNSLRFYRQFAEERTCVPAN
ncbi:MAG: diguanylate cyclase [Thermodesulfobacteriota bacterium]